MALTVDIRAACEQRTVDELQHVARELNVRGRSRMRKSELIQTLAGLPGTRQLLDDPPGAEPSTAPRKKRAAAGSNRMGGLADGPQLHPLAGLQRAAGAERDSRPRAHHARAEPPAPAADSHVGLSRLGLVAVDPRRVHVFWDLASAEMRRIRNFLEAGARAPDGDDPEVVLRLYPLSREGAARSGVGVHFDIRLPGPRGAHYVKLSRPGWVLRSEAGLRLGGKFVAVAWSNVVTLPGAAESSTFRNRLGLVAGAAPFASSYRERSFGLVEGERILAAEAALDLAPNASSVPRPGPVDAPDEAEASRKPAEPVVPVAVVERSWSIGLSSLELAGSLRSRRARDEHSVPSSSALSSWGRAPGAAESQASRPESAPAAPPVDESLTLRGHAQPGSRVDVQGVTVPVGNDGTFELSVPVSAIDDAGTIRLSTPGWQGLLEEDPR